MERDPLDGSLIVDRWKRVVLELHVEAEVPLTDDYPWDGSFAEQAFHDDGLQAFAHQVMEAIVDGVPDIIGVSARWTTRTEGGRASVGMGLEE
jgi:hypothetical protein